MSADDLPLEICREILVRLPAESLFRFRSVCRPWRTVIDDPIFGRAHTNHQLSSSSHTTLVIIEPLLCGKSIRTFDLDAVIVFDGDQAISGSSIDLSWDECSSFLPYLPVSACNGLMLVHPKTDRFEIWNTSTRERLLLPRIDFYHDPSPVFTGLGYDRAAQDLKAVVVHSQQTHVYSLRSDKWRTTTISFDFDLWGQENHGVFLCGALHWLLLDNKIIALDIGTEKPRHIQLNALQKLVKEKKIDVLGGCLVVSGYSDDSQFYDVWVMKDYGTGDESWTKLLSINRVDLTGVYLTDDDEWWTDIYTMDLRPVAYIKDKNQVFLEYGHGSGFILFDVESNSMKRVCINSRTGFSHAQIMPRNIFRLRDHCGGSGTRRIRQLWPPRKMNVSLTINSISTS